MKNRPGSQAATGLFPTHHRQWRLHTQAHSTSHTAQADPHTDVRSRAFGSTRLRRRRVDPAPLEGPHSTALLEAPTEEALAQQLAQQLQPHRLATVLNQLLPAAQLRWQSSFSLGAVEATVAPLLPKLLLLLTAVLWGRCGAVAVCAALAALCLSSPYQVLPCCPGLRCLPVLTVHLQQGCAFHAFQD